MNKHGIILAFHGWKQNPERFRTSSQLDKVATKLNCIIEYPKAKRLNWGGLNPHTYDETQLQSLDNVLNYLVLRYEDEWDKRLFLMGFSDGASFAGTLARYWSSKKRIVTGLVVYAGCFQQNPFTPTKEYPIIYIRGKQDKFVSIQEEDLFVKQYYPKHDLKVLRTTNGHKWNINVNPMIIEELQQYK